jgi:methionyl-tRNA formyltransferase
LNSGIDRGDIAAQDWCFIDPSLRTMKPAYAASELWHEVLLDMGLSLFDKVLDDISAGRIIRRPQDDRFATWEPTIKENEIYRPDALMLTASI